MRLTLLLIRLRFTHAARNLAGRLFRRPPGWTIEPPYRWYHWWRR